MPPFGIEILALAKKAVRTYIVKELYPTDTPDFNVNTAALSMFPTGDEWTAYFETNLPDGMIYKVVKTRGTPLTIDAFKALSDN